MLFEAILVNVSAETMFVSSYGKEYPQRIWPYRYLALFSGFGTHWNTEPSHEHVRTQTRALSRPPKQTNEIQASTFREARGTLRARSLASGWDQIGKESMKCQNPKTQDARTRSHFHQRARKYYRTRETSSQKTVTTNKYEYSDYL